MKNKYQVRLSHSSLIEAQTKEKAIYSFFQELEDSSNLPLEEILKNSLKVDKMYKASELKGEALEKVLEKYGIINVEDTDWAGRDEAAFLDIKELGLEVDEKRMCWNLDYPYRQLYFSNAHDGSGNTQIGIWVADLNKLVKRLTKDLKLPANIAKAVRDGEIELSFRTYLFGGGDGKTYFEYEDRTDKTITDDIPGLNLEEALQEWFEENVVKFLLSSFQKDYDYLTSKEAVVETLDANEMIFTVDGEQL